MAYLKAYEILLPHEYLRVRLFYHLAKDIYNVFEFGDGFEIVHNRQKLTLKQLNVLNENVKDGYMPTELNDTFVRLIFSTSATPYLILEKLWAHVNKSSNDDIVSHAAKLKIK